MRLVKACIALAAFAAIFVIPSMASAALELTHPTGTRAPVGTKILATNVEHSTTKTPTVLTTNIGNVECTKATITGELTKNNGTEVEGTITTAEFGGTPGLTTTGHCKGSGLLGEKITPTPSHTSDEDKSLPWCMKAEKEDIFRVWGEGKTCAEKREVTFTLHGAITCTYQAPEVIGTYTTHPAEAIVTVNKAAFLRSASSSAFCPKEGFLDLAFTLATDKAGEVTGEAVYIDK
jgi:hypothetical protein